MRRAAIVAALAGLAAAVAPASAEARDCSTKRGAKSVIYEDEVVQVSGRRWKQRYYRDVVACSRLTGRTSVVGSESRDPNGREAFGVEGVLGGRYLWTSEYSTAGESADVERHQLFDLQNRRKATATARDEDTFADLVAVPGALVTADGEELVRHELGGERTVLDRGQGVAAPAAAAATLYWRNGTETRSASLAGVEPAPGIAHPARPARRREPCLPRRRTVLLRDFGLVVSRGRGGDVVACRLKTRRRFDLATALGGGTQASGPPAGFDALDGRRLAYRLPLQAGEGTSTAVVVLDVATGRVRRSAIVGGLTGTATVRDIVAFADADAISLLEADGPREVVRAASTEVALGETETALFGRYLYWTEAGAARALDLTPQASSARR